MWVVFDGGGVDLFGAVFVLWVGREPFYEYEVRESERYQCCGWVRALPLPPSRLFVADPPAVPSPSASSPTSTAASSTATPSSS